MRIINEETLYVTVIEMLILTYSNNFFVIGKIFRKDTLNRKIADLFLIERNETESKKH